MSMPSSNNNDSLALKYLIQQLHRIERADLPPALLKVIQNVAKETSTTMSKKAADFLHETLDDRKHTENQVKEVINLFPEALCEEDEYDQLPIQNAYKHFERRCSNGTCMLPPSNVTFF